jgi:hypothetical protein
MREKELEHDHIASSSDTDELREIEKLAIQMRDLLHVALKRVRKGKHADALIACVTIEEQLMEILHPEWERIQDLIRESKHFEDNPPDDEIADAPYPTYF